MEALFSLTSPLGALITLWLAAIGLSIGSFLNVVIARLPADDDLDVPEPTTWWERWKLTFRLSGRAYKRLAWPPSRCPKCGHKLPWYENIPVVSWLMLRGKCSGCGAPISPRYILVELITGTLFVAAVARFGLDWRLVSALTFFTFLIPLIFIDAELWILPFELTLPAIAAGLLLAIPQGGAMVLFALQGAIAAFLIFRVMEFVGWLVTGREAMGAGDKYLMAMIGAQVGWRGLLGVILFSSLQGSVVGLIRLRLTGRAGPDSGEAPPEQQPQPGAAETEQEKDEEKDEEKDAREPFRPEFLKPGLSLWHRLLAIPYTLLLQDIPDSPEPDETTGEVPDWVPGKSNIPFGPWIGLAGIEVMLLGPFFVERFAHTQWRLLSEIVFGL